MKGRGYLFILIVMLGYSKAFAGSGFVKLADSTKLFYVNGTDIYSPDKDRLLYFIKGNIFFNGQSDQKENIYLVSTSMNPTSEELQSLMEKGSREASYSFSNNKFYAGREENEEFRERNALLCEPRGQVDVFSFFLQRFAPGLLSLRFTSCINGYYYGPTLIKK